MLQQERHFSLNNRYRLFAGNSNETGFKWFSGNDPARSAYHVSGVDCESRPACSNASGCKRYPTVSPIPSAAPSRSTAGDAGLPPPLVAMPSPRHAVN